MYDHTVTVKDLISSETNSFSVNWEFQNSRLQWFAQIHKPTSMQTQTAHDSFVFTLAETQVMNYKHFIS